MPLPKPALTCRVSANWRGIVPGASTARDVLRLLGKPSDKGSATYGDQRLSFYAYDVSGGTVKEFVKNRVFFRTSGVVDWIEEIVADRDGSFHSVHETLTELGSTLDTAYINSNYDPSNPFPVDVLAGPDYVYVWSECGVALLALASCSPSADSLECSRPDAGSGDEIQPSLDLTLRFPSPFQLGGPPPNPDDAVLLRMLFPPTTYEGFVTNFQRKVPFGLWHEYIEVLGIR